MTALAEKQSHTWTRSKHEWYVDLPSVSAAVFSVEEFGGSIHDPCTGFGNIVGQARLAGYEATGADISGRFSEWPQVDFFEDHSSRENIVFNPPYGRHPDGGQRLEERAILHALTVASGKVVAIQHLSWMAARLEWLKSIGCVRIWAVGPRPSMLPGSNLILGEKPGGGSKD